MTTSQKIAVVTGASSGIGKACSLALAKEGWSGRPGRAPSRSRLEETAEESGSAPQTLVVPTDVTRGDEGAVLALFDMTKGASAGSTCCSTTPASGSPPASCSRI